MLGIVLFIPFFTTFVATLVLHRIAWDRESTFGAYRDGNCRHIEQNVFGYSAMSVLMFVIYVLTSSLGDMVPPYTYLPLAALFLLTSGFMGYDAMIRKTSGSMEVG